MKFLAKYNKLVLSGIVAFFVAMLINHLIFTMREGLEDAPASAPAAAAAVPSEQQKASMKTINELQTEMASLNAEMTTLQKVVSLNQSKVDALKARIQSKQTEIDKLQSKIEVDNLATTAAA
jgi:peptidoglycan hydrolase CwlO-like protein